MTKEWKDVLGDRIPSDVADDIDVFENQMQLRKAGKLDENMLFYLLSRGIDPEVAQRLLKWAFLEDVVAKIDVPELRRQIEQSVAGQLNDTAVLKELI